MLNNYELKLGDEKIVNDLLQIRVCSAVYAKGDKYKRFAGFISHIEKKPYKKIVRYVQNGIYKEWKDVGVYSSRKLLAKAQVGLDNKIKKNKNYVGFGTKMVVSFKK